MTQLETLMRVGAFWGHPVRKWNPKMAQYIYGERGNMHILDLIQTCLITKKVCTFLHRTVERGGLVLFLGTDRVSAGVVAATAKRAGHFYVNERWLGGMLTNWSTIKLCLSRLECFDLWDEDGTFGALPKKEEASLRRQHARLKKYLGGVRGMKKLPRVVVGTGPLDESHALEECERLRIPTVTFLDSNGDPTRSTFVIPANTESVATLDILLTQLAFAIYSAKLG